MKERNRLFAILLSLAIVFAYMPAAAFAGTAQFGDFEGGDGDTPVTYYNDDGVRQTAYRTADGYAYTPVNSDGFDSVRIIGYNGGSTTMNVPAKINGHTVSGFSINPGKPLEGENYDAVKTIKLPDSVIYFRTKYLKGFKALESVSGTDGELDNDAYKTADGVLYKKYSTGLKAFYPQAKKSTAWTMDAECNKSIDFPKNCPIETLTISAGFSDQYDIYNYELPNLKAIVAPDDNPEFSTADGVLFSKDGTELLIYPCNKDSASYTVPDGVKAIDEDAFYNAAKLNSIGLPASLTSIRENAFNRCGISSVTIPANVEHIGEDAFDGCNKLKKIIFTAATAPADKDTIYTFRGVKQAVLKMDVAIEYPDGGEGYEEFIAALSNRGTLEPIPDNPISLDLGEMTNVTIAPGEVKTFKFTTDELYQYGLGVWSEDYKKIDYCFFTKDDPQYADGTIWVQSGQTSPHYDGYEYPTIQAWSMDAGETVYVQVRSSEENTTNDFQVKAMKSQPVGLAPIPDDCESLTLGTKKTGTISSADEIVTYKFTTEGSDSSDDEEGTPYSIEVTRPETTPDEYGHKINWRSALRTENSKYYQTVFYGEDDSLESKNWLQPDTTYYLQLMPGVKGTLSVKVKKMDAIDTYGFAPVPAEGGEPISVNEEKSVTDETESYTESKTFTFEFEPQVSGNYTFLSDGTSNTIGRVLDSDGNTIVLNDDSKTAGRRNFAVSFYGEAGHKYYLQTKLRWGLGGTETYTLKLTEYIGEHKHNPERVDAVIGDNDTDSTKAYYRCTICGRMYAHPACKYRQYEDTLTVPYGTLITGLSYVPAEGSTLSGDADSKLGKAKDCLTGFCEEGNKIVVTYDDGSQSEYICVKTSMGEEGYYYGYYLSRDTESPDISDSLKATVNNESGKLVAGDNEVILWMYKDGQYADCVVNVNVPGGHEHIAGEPVRENEKAATCTENGSYDEVVYCTECGQEMSREPKVINALGHSLTGHEALASTCEAAGNDPYWECGTCGKFFSDAEGTTEIEEDSWIIDALGHDWDEVKYEWDAGYTQLTATRSCLREGCGKVETETVGVVIEKETPATLTAKGHKKGHSKAFENTAFEAQSFDVEVPSIAEEYASDAQTSETAVNDAADSIKDKTDDEIVEQSTAVTEAEVTAQSMADKANEAAIAADNALQAAAEAAAADPDNADKQNALVEAKNQAAVAQKFKTSANITLSKAKAASAKVAAAKAAVARKKLADGTADASTMSDLEQATSDAATLAAQAEEASEAAIAAAQSLSELAGDEDVDAGIVGNSEEIAGIVNAAAATEDAVTEANDSKDAAATEELAGKKADAKRQLENYKAPGAYRAAQQTELANAINAGKAAIDAAEDEAGINAALAAAKSSIDTIKTDAQLAAEEAAAAAAAQPAEIVDLPAVKIAKPKAAKKKVTVKWKKVNKKNLKKIQGIEIRVTGPGVDKVVTAGKKKTSKKVGGLQSKQKYTVQVRAYAMIGGVKHVSAWKSKTVKVK